MQFFQKRKVVDAKFYENITSLLVNSKYLSVQVYHNVNVMSHCSIDNEDLLLKQSATLEFYMYFSEDFFQ